MAKKINQSILDKKLDRMFDAYINGERKSKPVARRKKKPANTDRRAMRRGDAPEKPTKKQVSEFKRAEKYNKGKIKNITKKEEAIARVLKPKGSGSKVGGIFDSRNPNQSAAKRDRLILDTDKRASKLKSISNKNARVKKKALDDFRKKHGIFDDKIWRRKAGRFDLGGWIRQARRGMPIGQLGIIESLLRPDEIFSDPEGKLKDSIPLLGQSEDLNIGGIDEHKRRAIEEPQSFEHIIQTGENEARRRRIERAHELQRLKQENATKMDPEDIDQLLRHLNSDKQLY